MCEFMRLKTQELDELPMCEYTKNFCTLCVLGNRKTYNEAKNMFNNLRGNNDGGA